MNGREEEEERDEVAGDGAGGLIVALGSARYWRSGGVEESGAKIRRREMTKTGMYIT